ncbi:uncharacterized protein LOC115999508 [Ipomoea triloba]|uniref:uncharacterized protein LOC115999508 n=1 Tax=Ipomoea triloba TaxID=35885 RepID=UPI00125E88C5|nr:uncharacterized protein LOC115999508 [Ipomoea triloba]
MWLKEDKCREIVTHSWDCTVGLDVLARIERCGRDIWRWGKDNNRNFQRKIDSCKRKMDLLRPRRDKDGMLQYGHTEKELLKLLEQQHLFWKQRAKEHWYKGADLNSKFFHNSVKSRKRSNKIHKLKNADGTWVENEDSIGQIMVDYFQTLFIADQGNMDAVLANILTKITPLDNLKLIQPVSTKEVRAAVFQMHPDKSPGPNVTTFCRAFIETRALPPRANDTYIVLIPKKLHKVLFVPGHLITYNVMLAYEVHHYLRRKTQGKEGVVALKVDMSKAYDLVEWGFLEAVMVKMGFDSKWIDILMETVRSV